MRPVVTTALLLLALVAPAPAAAYFTASGGGSASASADSLAAGSVPTVSASGQSVTVSWAQTSFRGALLGTYSGGGYTITRYPAAGGAAVAPSAACNTIIGGAGATLSCQESSVPAGSWRYTVTPRLNSWTGAESGTSASVDVATTLTSVVAQNPATGRSTGSIQLEWQSVGGATGYNVYRRAGSGAYDYASPLNGATPLTTTSYTDPGSGLTGGTTYSYVVRVVAVTEQSASSNELSGTAVARPPAPTGLSATPAAAATVTVAWSSVAGVAGYNVFRRLSTGSYDYAAPLNGATLVTATSYADVTAVDGTTYRYVVRSVITGAGGALVDSVDSTESAAATADGTSPTAVAVSDPGSRLRGSVTLSGTASDTGSGIASLRFQSAPAGTTTWSDRCTATVSPYSCATNTAALTDGLYDLRVIATDAAGNTTTSAVVANRRVDNTAPTVSLANPGSPVRGTITLTATASDPGTGVASVRIQRAPTGSSTFTDVCTVTTSPYSCSLVTTNLTDGGYDLRAVATDVAGNVGTSTLVANRVIDNTAPQGVGLQTTNVTGGTAGKPEAGDKVTYSFSEPIRPASILTGWSGASTLVTVRFSSGNPNIATIANSTNTTQLALGSFTSGRMYVTVNTTFSSSTMVLSGSTITVTLGTASGATSTATGTTTLQWTTSTAATDLAGNPLTAATVAETGALDVDF